MEDLLILEKQAVEAAINSNWLICINVNKKIIKIDKENIDAYLRLGFAYFQSNDLKNATKIYKKLLKLQPNNLTAKENLEKIKILKEKNIIIVPDVLANSGGVTVSYLEWVQGKQGYWWSEEEVNKRLKEMMERAFEKIWRKSKEKNLSLKEAAFEVALERIVKAMV